ncbi:MAG: YjjG family noncanonical pyrimidine nucleotidase [Bacteroidales bacterium]
MSKYKNIFIDLDDTIWNTRANARESMEEIFFEYQFDKHFTSFDFFYNIYNINNLKLWDLYHFGKITKQQLMRDRFLFPIQQGGIDDEKIAVKYGHDFLERTTTKTKLVPHAIELLDYLFPKYRLFILSNGFRELQHRKVANSGLAHYFEKIILSEDAGVNKPHPDIYHYALKTTNSRKSESIMIGDNPETDIAGAHKIKMDQIYFADNQSINIEFEPNYTVNSLLEIMKIL